ncbi:hypothetical protein SEVIR_1G122750v4 [Setaria viridis]
MHARHQPPVTLRGRRRPWWHCRTRLPAASDRDSRRLIGGPGRPPRIDGYAAVRVPAAARDDAPVPTRPGTLENLRGDRSGQGSPAAAGLGRCLSGQLLLSRALCCAAAVVLAVLCARLLIGSYL